MIIGNFSIQRYSPRIWNDPLSHELDDHEGGVGDEENDDHREGEVGSLLLCPGHVGQLPIARKIHPNRGPGSCLQKEAANIVIFRYDYRLYILFRLLIESKLIQ